MKQTFVQKFSSKHDAPISREMIARALDIIAKQLRAKEQPDRDQKMWTIKDHHSFEITGFGDLSQGVIKVTVKL